jgi:general nucleoside transport system permease protein
VSVVASVNDGLVVVVLAQAVLYGTPLLFAALGELLAERSGVLNLGVEGMMLFGAAVGYWATLRVHGSDAEVLVVAIVVAGVAGAAMSAIHAFLTVTLRASQIVSGLALTLFAGGLGLSAYFGNELHLADHPATHEFGSIDVFGLRSVPVVGPILFNQSALVYASWVLTAVVALYLTRTRWGLNVRAVGEAPASADAMGINVTLYRYVHVLLGGALAGIGGACYSLLITPGWVAGDTLVNGAGWIAIALVIFAFWRAELCLVGAYLFGALSALPFALQAHGTLAKHPSLPQAPEFYQALPYFLTIVVLVLVSTAFARRRLGAPAALGRPYAREER